MPVKTTFPRITLVCRYGHPFGTEAGPGCTVKCPTCKEAGKQVSKRVPSGRPLNQQELAAWESQDTEPGTQLAETWVTPELPETPDTPDEPEYTGEQCRHGDCAEPLFKVPGRAALTCANGHFTHTPGVSVRIAEHEQETEQKRARSDGIDVSPETKAIEHIKFRAEQRAALRGIGAWLKLFDPDLFYADTPAFNVALRFNDELTAIKELMHAASDLATLSIAIRIGNKSCGLAKNHQDFLRGELAQIERAENPVSIPDYDDDVIEGTVFDERPAITSTPECQYCAQTGTRIDGRIPRAEVIARITDPFAPYIDINLCMGCFHKRRISSPHIQTVHRYSGSSWDSIRMPWVNALPTRAVPMLTITGSQIPASSQPAPVFVQANVWDVPTPVANPAAEPATEPTGPQRDEAHWKRALIIGGLLILAIGVGVIYARNKREADSRETARAYLGASYIAARAAESRSREIR